MTAAANHSQRLGFPLLRVEDPEKDNEWEEEIEEGEGFVVVTLSSQGKQAAAWRQRRRDVCLPSSGKKTKGSEERRVGKECRL